MKKKERKILKIDVDILKNLGNDVGVMKNIEKMLDKADALAAFADEIFKKGGDAFLHERSARHKYAEIARMIKKKDFLKKDVDDRG